MITSIILITAFSSFAIRIIEFLIAYRKASIKYDPVKSCEVYKEIGCAHVDGCLCFMPTCQILKDYRDENQKTSQ
jgi:hypothetical protein